MVEDVDEVWQPCRGACGMQVSASIFAQWVSASKGLRLQLLGKAQDFADDITRANCVYCSPCREKAQIGECQFWVDVRAYGTS